VTLRPVLLMMLVAAFLILVIAFSNVANATLAETIARRNEFALRVALGGRTADIIRLVALEVVVLSVAGALGGPGPRALAAARAADPERRHHGRGQRGAH